MERLQKVLAHAGVASRRACEKIISEGRVTVNGDVVTVMGHKVDREKDLIAVDGQLISFAKAYTYILLNKPIEVITSVTDTHNRKTVLDLVKVQARVYPVGRLDYNTTGVLLLTDDGDLAYQLTHPSFGVWKTYRATISGKLNHSEIRKLTDGILLEEGLTAPAKCRIVQTLSDSQIVELSIHEGRKRQIRRMFDELDRRVIALERILFGSLSCQDLNRGAWRYLTDQEVSRLKQDHQLSNA